MRRGVLGRACVLPWSPTTSFSPTNSRSALRHPCRRRRLCSVVMGHAGRHRSSAHRSHGPRAAGRAQRGVEPTPAGAACHRCVHSASTGLATLRSYPKPAPCHHRACLHPNLHCTLHCVHPHPRPVTNHSCCKAAVTAAARRRRPHVLCWPGHGVRAADGCHLRKLCCL